MGAKYALVQVSEAAGGGDFLIEDEFLVGRLRVSCLCALLSDDHCAACTGAEIRACLRSKLVFLLSASSLTLLACDCL